MRSGRSNIESEGAILMTNSSLSSFYGVFTLERQKEQKKCRLYLFKKESTKREQGTWNVTILHTI